LAKIIDYLTTNYYLLIIIASIILLAIIGYFADKKKRTDSAKMNSEIRRAEDIDKIKQSFKEKGLSINQAVKSDSQEALNKETQTPTNDALLPTAEQAPPPTVILDKPINTTNSNDDEVL